MHDKVPGKRSFRFISILYFLGAATVFLVQVPVTSFAAAPGALDGTFSGDGRLTDGEGWAFAVASQPDGKIVVINFELVIARYDPGGTPDTSFGGGTGRVTLDFGFPEEYVRGFAIQPDGKIVVGAAVGTGGTAYFGAARFNPDGSPDPSFGGGTGKVLTALPCGNFNNNFGAGFAIQPDGKMLASVGFEYCSSGELLRYRPDGSLDPSFGPNGNGTISADVSTFSAHIAIQSNGKIVVAGAQRLLRFETNGSPDLGFNSGFEGFVYSVISQPDNKIVTNNDFHVFRRNEDGSLDTSFDGDGIVVTPIVARSVAIQADGRMVVAGVSDLDFGLVRYNVDGSLDSTFGGGDGITTTDFDGSLDGASDLALDTTGRAVVVGESYFKGISRLAIARFLVAPTSTPFDFDGDGRSDISVFRPSDSVWYFDRSTEGFFATQFGLPTDKITPADFDGDGKTDVAVYRPATGTWYWLNSSNGAFNAVQFGASEDLPTPADYDGDDKADVSVFRPSNGVWYRLNSSNGSFYAVQFGAGEDKPTIGDYDGDGSADVAVFRPSSGVWYRLNSSNGAFVAVSFGLSSDLTTPADFDGDGTADLAVYRPSSGIWYWLNSSNGALVAAQFGSAEDIPSAADFDGDGKADISLFRPSNGVWYRHNSSDGGYVVAQFGANGDRPTPAAFRF